MATGWNQPVDTMDVSGEAKKEIPENSMDMNVPHHSESEGIPTAEALVDEDPAPLAATEPERQTPKEHHEKRRGMTFVPTRVDWQELKHVRRCWIEGSIRQLIRVGKQSGPSVACQVAGEFRNNAVPPDQVTHIAHGTGTSLFAAIYRGQEVVIKTPRETVDRHQIVNLVCSITPHSVPLPTPSVQIRVVSTVYVHLLSSTPNNPEQAAPA